ncbi:hypothetical protein UAY_01906 [Enterococcus moraviensis ATCC BAA-383]|uniref:Uncharacterized protein n=1 Tax=Enterococcus moraviensis ATCC BAA-383 TaxID=1158609 RepID=R2TG39_9ENTE|nr:Ig-like domain-containing protein [Enterococcus moraviensis]EOH99129.1 hypothetical protein UAY_01906 [Enterococcus moraviensis ATCC BAA-383]EOT72188.1 hypothetical protein I586_01996 [Enterococcus moraviensis ATCC BAA-383]OJG67380.1 hypothetical protein RV09_GL002596 [Enterococcus moraviensis]
MIGKHGKKIIYGIMTVLIFIQYFIPIISVAETLTDVKEIIQLNSVEVKKEGSDKFTLEIKGTATNEQAQELKKELTISDGISLVEQGEVVAQGNTELRYTTGKNKIELTVPSGSDGAFTIIEPIDQQQVTNGQQVLTTKIASTETSSTQPVKETDKTTETQETKTTTSVKEEAKKEDVSPKADTPTDIRDYFPGGDGTIITGADVVYTDKDGNVLTSPIPADANVNIHYDWAIPEEIREQIKAGDYFTFQLPPEVKINGPQSGSLKGPDGVEYATYTIDENGKVTITFTENVTKEIDINGDFNFETKFDTQHIDGPGDHQITFPTEDNIPPVDVTVKPATETSISKDGQFDRTPNPTSVEWTVDINQGMNELSNPEVTEHWPNGIKYKSVKVYKLVMNLDGTVKEVAEELDPSQYTVDANGNVKILGDTSDAYRIVY